jgi:hypothetical protein
VVNGQKIQIAAEKDPANIDAVTLLRRMK